MNEIPNDLLVNKFKPKTGNHAISEVIDHFERSFNLKLKRVKQQRFAAYNLIRRYGKANVMKATSAAAIVRNEKYAPQILTLQDLWEKYDKLQSFYKRNQTPGSTNLDNIKE